MFSPVEKYGSFSFILTLLSHTLNAAPAGLVGGQDNAFTTPYTAILSSEGVATTLTGDLPLANQGKINSVMINRSGTGVIGGYSGFTLSNDPRFVGNGINTAYAAFVSPDGVATLIPMLPTEAGTTITSVAINDSGLALIGGKKEAALGYIAFASPGGNAVPVSYPGDMITYISSVAINASGGGIVGGTYSSTGIVALVSSSSSAATPITGATPPSNGEIYSVAINDSGYALAGGRDAGMGLIYGVFVAPSGAAAPLSGAFPGTDGNAYSVAINNSGRGIVGGRANGNIFINLLSGSPVTSNLSGGDLPTGAGNITAVAINESGAAIAAGVEQGNIISYAALISPAGVAKRITGDIPGLWAVNSVAINEAGAGLIGGTTSVVLEEGLEAGPTTAVALLVSPSGVATSITGATPTGNGIISSVSLKSALSQVVPVSFGAGNSFANSLFALSSQVLANHLTHFNGLGNFSLNSNTQAFNYTEGTELVADASDIVRKKQIAPWGRGQKAVPNVKGCRPNYSFWGDLFGNNAYQKAVKNFPSSTNWIAGFMLGFDYQGMPNAMVGGGFAYAFDYVDLGNNAGHAKINQEFLTVYGGWSREYFYIDAALWAGLYQMHNVRHSIANITSTSNVDGWLFSPHVEFGTPFFTKCNWLALAPFAMFDWANNWQGHVREQGSAGFNVVIGNQYTSLLRSEIGLRVFEYLQYAWGTLVLQEKASYVNKAPFHTGTTLASFIGAASSFAIETFSSEVQNLGALQIEATFVPWDIKYPYGSINFQTEFGAPFQSYLLSFEIGKDF